jgi:hypothetical protein
MHDGGNLMPFNRTLISIALGVIASVFGAGSSFASVIFSDFSNQAGHYCCGGYAVAGPNSASPGGAQTQADAFTSPINAAVSQIDVALGNLSGTNSAIVSLWTDVGSALGTELGAWTLSGQGKFAPGFKINVYSITGISNITLGAGSSYFLQIAPGAADTFDGWYFNRIGYADTHLINGISFPGSIAGAFQVLSPFTPVPEPRGWIVLLVGLGGLGAAMRLSRSSVCAGR